jgi:transcriptional regulator with XRE-family HTH domain
MSNQAVTCSPLRAIRESKGYSQRRLAAKSGVPRSVIQSAEAGVTVPHGTTLHKLARELDCSIAELCVPAEGAA